MVLFDSTSLDIMHNVQTFYISEFFGLFFKINEIVFNHSAMILKVLYRFLNSYSVLWQYEVNSDSKHGSFNAQHFLAFLLHYLKKTFNLLCNED